MGADPKQPIRSDDGIELPLDSWMDLILERHSQQVCQKVERMLSQHASDCPARRLFWVALTALVGGIATGLVFLVRALI
ncbi:MAG: hypothetical protein R6X20_02355 [Phycisphaerae bacterium]